MLFENLLVFLKCWYGFVYLLRKFVLIFLANFEHNIPVKKLLKLWNYFTIFIRLFCQKKSKQGWLRIWNFQGYLKNRMQRFQESIKQKWNFQGWSRKNHVEFPFVLVSGFGISNGCKTVLSGISRGKVTNLKIPGVFSKNYVLKPPALFAFFLE